MRFSLLGTLLVESREGSPYELGGSKPRRLVALLALRYGEVVTVDELVDVLWADEQPPSATNALHVQISKLRRALGRDGEPLPLRTVSQGYVLEVAPDDVDVSRFERLTRDGAAHAAAGRFDEAAAVLDEALGLWRGPALAEFAFEDFAAAARLRLDELRSTAQEHRIDALLGLGHHELVIPELEATVATTPLRERPWAQLMMALYRSGRQADALRAFGRARAHLVDEMGIDPGPELRDLEARILRQDPTLAGNRPTVALAAPSNRPFATNLRPELSSFVGRADEVRTIGMLVAERRLVTILGPGGVGKTRLATEIALHHEDPTSHGTWLLELQGVSGTGAVARAFLATFGGKLDGAGSVPTDVHGVVDRVAAMIGETAMLLVLDNCEHVVTEAALAVDALLRACPNVRILATSRVVLDLPGEAVRQLRPLGLDDAMALFGARGLDASDGFDIDVGNHDAVRSICERVDRLPLGIELAAARLRAFTPAQLDARLSDRLGGIGGSSPTRAARHQTMPATVAWSYDLLFEDERSLLRALSVFRGSFALDAVAPVAGGDAIDVEDTLARLVDKSLVVAEGGAPARYRLLRTVADFAASQAAQLDETSELRDRHASWIGDLAARAHDGIRGPEHPTWAQRLRDDAPNVYAAMTWLQEAGDPLLGMRIGADLGWFAFTSTIYPAVIDALLATIERAPDAPGPLRALAIGWAGLLGSSLSHTATFPAEAIAVARESGDPAVLAEVLLLAAVPLALRQASADRAIELIREGRAVALSAGEEWWAASSLTLEGTANMMAVERLPTAVLLLEDGVRRFVELGDRRSAEICATYLSRALEDVGDLDAAEAVLAPFADGRDASISVGAITALGRLAWIADRRGDHSHESTVAEQLLGATAVHHRIVPSTSASLAYGLAKLASGELAAARQHLLQAAQIHEQIGFDREVVIEHAALGRIAALTGDAAESRHHHDRSIELGQRFGMPLPLAIALEVAAASAVRCGDALRAAELHGWSMALRDRHRLVPTDHEAAVGARILAAAEGMAGAEVVAAAVARGEAQATGSLAGAQH